MTILPHPLLACALLCAIGVLSSCGNKKPVDPCCTLSALPTSARLAEDQGALQVNGKTNGYFYVFDEAGKQVAYESLNKTLPLEPGLYTVRVNNSSHPLEIDQASWRRALPAL